MKDLTKGHTFNVLLKFAIPLIIAGVLSQTYNLIDLIVAGRFIGSDALSSTGCTSTFIQFLSSIFWGTGVATATICGELYGEKKKKEIVLTIKTIITTVTVVMLVISFLCIIFVDPILFFLKVDSDIFQSAKNYFMIYMAALFLQAITFEITSTLQSLGDSKFPMIIIAISSVLNIGLNLFFVLVLKMGVIGLAVATVISSAIGLLLGIIKIGRVIKQLDGNVSFEFSFKCLKKVTIVAIPCILQQCSLYLSSVIVQPFVNGLGKEVSAGYSVAMNISLLLNALYHSVSRSLASYSSQSKGAKLYNNFGKGIKYGILLQVILVAPFAIICAIIPNQICLIFSNDNGDGYLPYATQFMYLCLPFLIFACLGNLFHSFYKSVEATKTVLVSTTIFTIARVLFTYLIPNVEYIFSIYLGLSLAWLIEAIVLTVIYFTGIWKSKDQKEFEFNRKLREKES